MKTLFASTLLLALSVGQVQAQQNVGVGRVDSAELKLMEIEQDVDQTVLKEALLLLARKDLRPSSERPKNDDAREIEGYDAKVLADVIEAKKKAIIKRAAQLRDMRHESAVTVRPTTRIPQPDAQPKQANSEEVEKSKVEIQLLRTQVQLSQQALTQVINELAKAEHEASVEEISGGKLEPIRRRYDKTKADHILYSKRLRDEFSKLNALDPQAARELGGFRGGMGGMGGFQ